MLKLARYGLNILVGIDQLANAVCGGDPDESISSRVGRRWPDSWLRKAIDFVFGPDHCKENIENITIDQELI